MRNPNPTTAKRQLRAFYASQGLQGQAHRHAVRADMKKVMSNSVAQNRVLAGLHKDRADFLRAVDPLQLGLAGMFLFSMTPERLDYWQKRSLEASQ